MTRYLNYCIKKYIYENNIKTTPVYIQQEMTISNQTVFELKQMLKQNGLKVTGTKPILIQRLIDAGLVDQSIPMEKQKLKQVIGPYAKMRVVEIKSLLRKYGLKLSGLKDELIARLEESDAITRHIELEKKEADQYVKKRMDELKKKREELMKKREDEPKKEESDAITRKIELEKKAAQYATNFINDFINTHKDKLKKREDAKAKYYQQRYQEFKKDY